MTRHKLLAALLAAFLVTPAGLAQEDKDLAQAIRLQQSRVELVRKITPAVCAIFRGGGGGSGVIISPDGWVLSNFHVTGFSKTLRVGLPDHKIYKATVIGVDPTGDIALLKLHGKKVWPYAPLGDSDSLELGEWVIAAGNPFLLATDFSPTVTMGVVSGTHRFLSGAGGFRLTYPDAISTDAPINPGNSGGPLFNMAGEVVGINGRISLRDRGRVNIGAGYAISANAIKNLLGTLHSGEIVERGNMDATVRNQDGKVLFDQMFEDSAAHNAGLRIGDELLEFDGQPIRTANQFMNRIWVLISGWKIKVVIRRDGKRQTFWVTLTGIPQRGKKRKGDWKPLGEKWRRTRATQLSDGWSAYRGPRQPLTLAGSQRGKKFSAKYNGFEPVSIQREKQITKFGTAVVKRDGKELTAAAARRMRLSWALAPLPADLLGGSHLTRGELHSSGRIGGRASIMVLHSGPDDEQLRFHYDLEFNRLLGIERFVNEKLDLTIEYRKYRKFGKLKLATERRITPAKQKPYRITIQQATLDSATHKPGPIAAEAPRTRPRSSLGPALERVSPALVKIYGAGHVKGIPAYGTGVICSPDGRILTYNSAMLTTPNLYVILQDGRHMPAKVVHRDYDRDVAIIQINGKKLPFLEPYSGQPLIGQWVVAIGNAFNLSQGAEPLSVHLGVLSAKTQLHARRGLADFPYKGQVYIVDAQINPGAYGGPLIDSAGRWIGLSGKVLGSKETNTQFHYALPVSAIRDLIAGKPRARATKTKRTGRRAYTGLIFLDAGPFRSPPPYVDRVFPASPGSKAGFRKDDLIMRVDEKRIKTIEDFKAEIRRRRPGDVVALSVKRGNKVLRVKLTLEVDEDDEDEGPATRKKPTTHADWLVEYAAQLREAQAPYAKHTAALKLAGMGPSAAKHLAGLLRLKDSEIRRAAMAGLSVLGPDAALAVAPLREILDRGRAEDLRQLVVTTLAKIGPAALPAATDLIQLLGGPNVLLRQDSFAALLRIGPEVVPAVLAALGSGKDPALLQLLQKIGKPALPRILKIFDDRPQDRLRALRGLGALGPLAADALPRVLPLLESKDRTLRLAAMETLGSLQDPRAAAQLSALLATEERAAIEALEAMGPAAAVAVPGLAKLLALAQQPARATRLLRCLGAIGKPSAPLLQVLAAVARKEKLAWVPELPRTLSKLGPASLDTLRALLASDEPSQIQVGLAAAGLLEKKALPLLEQILSHSQSPHPSVRRLSLEATGTLGQSTAPVIQALLEALKARRREIVWSASWAIGRCKITDPRIRRRLIRLTSSFDDTTQEAALRALGETGGPTQELAPVFMRHLTHFKPSIRVACAWGLGQLKDLPNDAIKALLDTFAAEDWELKSAAVRSLGKVGSPAVLKLMLTLGAPDPAHRFLAAAALEEMGPAAARAVAPLIKLLKDRRAEIRERAAAALGKIGKPAAAARKALIGALDDEMLEVANAALTALRRITGRSYRYPEEWTNDKPYKKPTANKDGK